MIEQYQQMLDTERLILSPRRRLRYFESVIACGIFTIIIIGFCIYVLARNPENLSVLLVILIPVLFTLYVYRHQSSGLRLKKILTESTKDINQKHTRAAVEKMGWLMTIDDGIYMEAIVPLLGVPTIYSQLII